MKVKMRIGSLCVVFLLVLSNFWMVEAWRNPLIHLGRKHMENKHHHEDTKQQAVVLEPPRYDSHGNSAETRDVSPAKGDPLYDAYKRKVPTGPNPLHH